MMNVYLCGGCGINVGKRIQNGVANTVFVDSSQSNLKGIDPSKVFLIEGSDGAGKKRSTTYNNFQDVTKDVLIPH
jgi:hypothetical protein